MIILCDTCSIFLLLRIAPEMFIDPSYGCATLPDMYNELFRTKKFKEKYPWRTDYKQKVKALPISRYASRTFDEILKTIRSSIDIGVIDTRTEAFFTLSPEDCVLIACAIANGFEISSGDRGLVAFAQQEYPAMFKGNLSALEVINRWLINNVITWDESKQALLLAWKQENEAPQPKSAIQQFIRLTGREYPGT